jgi:hypothetical protein
VRLAQLSPRGTPRTCGALAASLQRAWKEGRLAVARVVPLILLSTDQLNPQ